MYDNLFHYLLIAAGGGNDGPWPVRMYERDENAE